MRLAFHRGSLMDDSLDTTPLVSAFRLHMQDIRTSLRSAIGSPESLCKFESRQVSAQCHSQPPVHYRSLSNALEHLPHKSHCRVPMELSPTSMRSCGILVCRQVAVRAGSRARGHWSILPLVLESRRHTRCHNQTTHQQSNSMRLHRNKIVVCLGPHPGSRQKYRTRLASALLLHMWNCRWTMCLPPSHHNLLHCCNSLTSLVRFLDSVHLHLPGMTPHVPAVPHRTDCCMLTTQTHAKSMCWSRCTLACSLALHSIRNLSPRARKGKK